MDWLPKRVHSRLKLHALSALALAALAALIRQAPAVVNEMLSTYAAIGAPLLACLVYIALKERCPT